MEIQSVASVSLQELSDVLAARRRIQQFRAGGSSFVGVIAGPQLVIGTKMTLRGPEIARMPPPSNQLRCRVVDRRSIAESENVVRSKTSRGEGLVPRWGRGRAWQNPPCQFAVPSHNSSFSYLGVPAPAGMSDWYENAPTPLRLCLGIPQISRIVIPAKAGIQRGGERGM